MNIKINSQKLPHKEPLSYYDNCPMCGHFLIVRENSQKYRFIGCTNYPKCPFTTSEKLLPLNQQKTT